MNKTRRLPAHASWWRVRVLGSGPAPTLSLSAPPPRTRLQVADGWHLWHNLVEAVEKTVIAECAALRVPEPEPEPK